MSADCREFASEGLGLGKGCKSGDLSYRRLRDLELFAGTPWRKFGFGSGCGRGPELGKGRRRKAELGFDVLFDYFMQRRRVFK